MPSLSPLGIAPLFLAALLQTQSETPANRALAFTDDFSTQTWLTGSWKDGRAWYENGEYHMHAIKGRFIEVYAPNGKEYYTRCATVSVSLRSVDGDPPGTGYGLVVHGEKHNHELEDYGFLVYNRYEPKYKIVLHKGGAETNIVGWTTSRVIRTDTTPNQLEVRIRDLKLDFYMNGQFITSINDSANYQTGRVGFYTSDVNEVAFDNLDVRLSDIDPNDATAYRSRATARVARGEPKGAIDDFNKAIDVDSHYAQAYNDLAWLLSTSPKSAVRDGRRAFECATRAAELTNWKDPGILDTLAAAHAENGNFAEAIRWEQKSLSLPGLDRSFANEARKRLRLYRQNKAYREHE